LNGNATKVEKIILAVYFFKSYTYLINCNIKLDDLIKTHSNKDDIVNFYNKVGNNNIDEYFEFETFNYYFANRQIKNYMNNMVEEINVNIHQAIYTNSYCVKDQQKHILQLEFIKKICDILDLKSSYDTKTIIFEEQFMRFVYYWKDMSKNEKEVLKSCFKIRLNSKSDILIAKQVVNSCINQWNGFYFSRNVTERIQVSGQKEIQKYNYCIKKDEDLIKNVFSMLIQ
jgi:predicted DNA-binding protein